MASLRETEKQTTRKKRTTKRKKRKKRKATRWSAPLAGSPLINRGPLSSGNLPLPAA